MSNVWSSVEGKFRSRDRARFKALHASSGDLEDAPFNKLENKSSGSVLPNVGVACLGAILVFGYILGVVNGVLEYLYKDLGNWNCRKHCFARGRLLRQKLPQKRLYGKEKVAAGIVSSTKPDAYWLDLFSKQYWKGIASYIAASALVGAANVFGTAIASSLMDKKGRKTLVVTSFTGMAASMLLLSLSASWKALAPYAGTLTVVGTVLYVLSFSLGAGLYQQFFSLKFLFS